MRSFQILWQAIFLLFIPCALAASSWSFDEATVSISGKGAGVGGGFKEKLAPEKPLSKAVSVGAGETLKILLTTTDGKTPKKAHQAFLTLKESKTGLEESFPFTLRETGKGKVELTQKDLPYQFLTSSSPVEAFLVIASFGTSTPYKSKAFDLSVAVDPNSPIAVPDAPVRYGKRPEIHHIFRGDPTSPPKIITLVFTAAVLSVVPILLGAWLTLGANTNHIGKAMSSAPLAHTLFFGSILAMEGVFFMYYTSWNLFQTLPVALGVGVVGYVSGSRALTEVQERRLAGER
ncbi:hypothetical protein NA57DRAFT_32124 [Rhizodiscina lignyota]|uniref:Ribophorin II C-terminal domain-containing protein n=1 Tax=Rhizodiscina lignyota TaxID=1504668 RepID=A0A9P4M9S4_9PEZI|nr:hypothetical protein NA57DRAFT_32124 [Rhizodiscina lignyota]